MSGVPASSHGGAAPPLALTGTDVNSTPLVVTGAVGQVGDIFTVQEGGYGSIFKIVNGQQIRVIGSPAMDADGGPLFQVSDSQATTDTWLTQVGGAGGAIIIKNSGHMFITAHAAPADADISAGECALWFDQTNAASKLMIKGKSANGTVVAASVALA